MAFQNQELVEHMSGLQVSDDKDKLPAQQFHTNARSNQRYGERIPVQDSNVPWYVDFMDYNPPDFTHPVVLANNRDVKEGGWADPPLDDNIPCPQNPQGRTGLKGRGLLGKWGANQAADPMVCRRNPESNQLEVVLIQRKDTGEWAIPGGMVDDGDSVSRTLRKEFEEEAARNEFKEDQEVIATIFSPNNRYLIYEGYVDDSRNTDNAWMETSAYLFVCTERQAKLLKFESQKGETLDVKWIPFSELDHIKLFASHRDFLEGAERELVQRNLC